MTSSAAAQEPVEEQPDPTRLDVERLPVEAIDVSRDLYEHGWFVEAMMGGRGFQLGIGRVAKTGLYLNVGLGYELLRWLWVKVSIEGSIHETDAPPPPSPTVFEIMGGLVELRLQWNVSSRVALWLGGEGGVVVTTGDVLPTYGFQDADSISLMYGGSLGFDWHMQNRHHSVGLMGGARLYPGLSGFDGSSSYGVHGAAYIRYSF